MDHERGPKTGRKSCLRFHNPPFRAGYFRRVGEEKVIDGLLWGEAGDGWENSEGISGEKKYHSRVACDAGRISMIQVGDRESGPCVFR